MFNRKLATSILDTPLDKEPEFPSGVEVIWFYPELPSARMKAQNGLFLMPLGVASPFMRSLGASLRMPPLDQMEKIPHISISAVNKLPYSTADMRLFKFVFKHEMIAEARDLVLLSNCSRENLFPDIDGVAASVKAQIEQSLS